MDSAYDIVVEIMRIWVLRDEKERIEIAANLKLILTSLWCYVVMFYQQ